MTKAEERANEKYPLMQEDDKEGLEALKYIGVECDSVSEYNSVRCSQQAYFIEGYHQAEKDLADAFINKAVEWIDKNAFRYIVTRKYQGLDVTGLDASLAADFKKALEDIL